MKELSALTGFTVRNLRSTALVLLVVASVTGANLWVHRGSPPVGYGRYDKHGFSMDYPLNMNFNEMGLSGSKASDASGSIQLARQDETLTQYGLFWMGPEMLATYLEPTPEGSLNMVFGIAGLEGTSISSRDELISSTKDGHELVYQTIMIEEPGVSIPAIIGAWYCEALGRFMILYLFYVPDFDQIEVLSPAVEPMWLGLVESVVCHR